MEEKRDSLYEPLENKIILSSDKPIKYTISVEDCNPISMFIYLIISNEWIDYRRIPHSVMGHKVIIELV